MALAVVEAGHNRRSKGIVFGRWTEVDLLVSASGPVEVLVLTRESADAFDRGAAHSRIASETVQRERRMVFWVPPGVAWVVLIVNRGTADVAARWESFV
jgi:hypothetical protein